MTKCKKIFCALLSVCLITVAPIGTVFSVSAEEEETDTHSLAERISNLGQKKEEYEKILQKNAKEISDKEEYNRALTEKIKVLSEKVTLTRESISDLTDSISTSQKEIDQANEDIEGQLDALCGRLRAIYMAGSASELEIILGAKDFSDMIDKVNLVKTLTKYDDELIENISDKLDEIENKQTQMQEDKEQLLTDETTLDADLKDFNKTLEENEETLKKLRDSSAEAQDFLADADNEQTLMESQIRKYFEKKAQTADIVTDGKYVWPCPGYYTLSSLFRENRVQREPHLVFSRRNRYRGRRNHGFACACRGSGNGRRRVHRLPSQLGQGEVLRVRQLRQLCLARPRQRQGDHLRSPHQRGRSAGRYRQKRTGHRSCRLNGQLHGSAPPL